MNLKFRVAGNTNYSICASRVGDTCAFSMVPVSSGSYYQGHFVALKILF